LAIALVAPRLAASDQAVYLIDDFDSPTALQGWTFDSTPESGGLALGPGHREHGAVLSYRLTCARETICNSYAAARWRPASPLPKKRDAALSLWIRFPPGVEVTLEVKDTSSQTLRFPIEATIEHPKAGDWQYAVVPLSAKQAGGIKGRLVEIGILVQARAGPILQGSVSFDEVRLRESAETFHVDPAAPDEPRPPESSELAPRLGVNIHLLRDDHSLDLAHAAGFGFVRMDMLWANVERNGRYRFFAYDNLLRALEARGMGVLWILDYGHPDHGGSTPRTPQDVAAFSRFAEAAAEHFKGRNVRYEIWNEPNTSEFWKPSPNASEYAILLREAVAAIRRADPSAKVSSGGLARFDTTFLSKAVDPSLAASLTAIGVHPYPKTGPETIAPELGNLREWVARSLGQHIEIWDTEWGYSSANAPIEAPSNGHSEDGRHRQASLSVREILTVGAVGLPLAVWYDLRDDGTDPANPEHNYGLLDSSGNEKPAIKAIRTLMSVVSGRRYAGMIQETPEGIHAMRMDGLTDTVVIVWTDQPDGRRRIEYPTRNLISATDLMGQAVKLKGEHSGQARVEIDAAAGPLYLLWSSAGR
jgi:Cellulase (glycosyl hydrolase family 5)